MISGVLPRTSETSSVVQPFPVARLLKYGESDGMSTPHFGEFNNCAVTKAFRPAKPTGRVGSAERSLCWYLQLNT